MSLSLLARTSDDEESILEDKSSTDKAITREKSREAKEGETDARSSADTRRDRTFSQSNEGIPHIANISRAFILKQRKKGEHMLQCYVEREKQGLKGSCFSHYFPLFFC